MQLIRTEKDRCHECYACVRNCPVKAVRVKEGQAEVLTERCINCANCLNVCNQNAKKVINYKEEVKQLLKSDRKVVAGIAPSFPAYNSELGLKSWEKILISAGFSQMYEIAWGAQLMTRRYKEYLQQNEEPVISTTCPVIVKFVEKYFPDLVSYLAPIISPMEVLVNYIKFVEGSETEIVLIGPCHAKKAEFAENDDVAAVLTFTELDEILEEIEEKVDIDYNIDNNPESKDKPEPVHEAREIPLAGGLLKGLCNNEKKNGYLRVEGHEKIEELFNLMAAGEIKPKFVDALYCEGCINGLDLKGNNFYKKELALNKFIDNSAALTEVNYDQKYYDDINLKKEFEADYQHLQQPNEAEIWEILNKTNKYGEEDLLNCGACGYETCRDKAKAVYQGLAEVEMCLPYLLAEKRSEVKMVKELKDEMDNMINSSYDGMVVVDNKGQIERVNDAYASMLGFDGSKLADKNMVELEKERIIYPSVSLLCLQENRNITIVQNTKTGKRILATATPIMDENNEIKRVIVNARDIHELDMIIDEENDNENMRVYLDNNKVEDNVGAGHIISSSHAMKNILKISQKMSNIDSNVLITGESGVGKEVVARYIHEQSKERKDFIKINCASIPEKLLESELFGYETGAFSGARSEGKPGLIEEADDGTLFLDEIGEMPLNMQAKLLQVIQEHKVTRIGGIKPVAVNFRLITATNRDIKQMVQEGGFREDLFFRLNVVPIKLPPLRNRREDILPLVKYFLNKYNEKYNQKVKFSKEAKQLLFKYNWPGNVRELINLLERVVVTAESEVIDESFLKSFIDFDSKTEVNADNDNSDEITINKIIPMKEAVAKLEKKLLAMARDEGKTTYEMAKMLDVNQSTVVRKLKKYFK